MTWAKGQSGNPQGRRKEDDSEVKALARKHTKAAVKTLAKWMRSNNPKAAVSAATALLDRGYGKPGQTIDANVNALVGQYTAIPTEQRDSDSVASSAGPATPGDPPRPH